ncbi:unnamed protein product [Rotaria socialis]|uniref:MACPF domain-containing protein n=1 Tax=Rotaria socialis TaxID=392032 RepID=A0A817WQS0_9BILA|nr:unnamed protein product [Rotaria socialis]CAF4595397.1 unnamed protein product [Rotaria socialis]
MQRSLYVIYGILSFYVRYSFLSTPSTAIFQFTEEARAAICPFVGTEGMRCFDGSSIKPSGRMHGSDYAKLPRGVGICVDRSTGRLMALAVQLTYPPEGTRVWTDGHTGAMFDIFNEAIIGPANRVVAAYDTARVHIFRNASQLNTAWRQTFADNRVRGGELARPPDLMEYFDSYFAHGHALALSQRVIGLYTLTINASTIQLNPFARHALSQLTTTFDPDLYEDFVEAWGTYIITRSLVGGMIEERAQAPRCLNAGDDGVVAQCIPFSDRIPVSSSCAYYADRTRMISKRHLGGNIQVENDNDWRRTLAVGPALLQILEMVP